MAITNGTAKGFVVSFGEMIIDFVPTVAGVSLAEAPGFVKAPGGAPANAAIAVSRLGGQVAFIGKLGADEFGFMLAGILQENGVNDKGVVFDETARTGLSFVTIGNEGERDFMFYRHPSADMLLRESELNQDLIRRAAIFHYGSISLIEEPCRSTQLVAMEVAKKAGALLSFDPNLRLRLWDSPKDARAFIMRIWKQSNIIKVSDAEVEFLTDKDTVEDDAVLNLWHPELKLLLVTLGGKGCKYYTKDFQGTVKGIAVKPIDTTGAGDAFVGAMLKRIADDQSALQDERKLREVLRFANACGAITTTKRGAIPALPREAEVLELLERA